MRKTDTPASINLASISGVLQAGPTVATIFVRARGVTCAVSAIGSPASFSFANLQRNSQRSRDIARPRID
jgi:hypothetical protein